MAVALDPIGNAIFVRPFAAPRADGKALRLTAGKSRTVRPQWTGGAVGVARPADSRAKIHQGLAEVAGAARRQHCLRQPFELSTGGALHRVQPRDHSLDIGIDGDDALTERDSGDCRSGIIADSR